MISVHRYLGYDVLALEVVNYNKKTSQNLTLFNIFMNFVKTSIFQLLKSLFNKGFKADQHIIT
ncbi:hypothetical protein [uncultured Gammaproteobacteria bacterium]|nr:hypothetical protein [uncultured Gammaproteobacteria bacterium]CAC9614092.1 hypothetical protein [uncultured Gammaproteobacteria bacterium]CAC9614444.1 hypothetical protein [uncultured Gammaproteobacteria bacterium]CAC9617918.1 hypothetical protein [uncultured Gammaproteobacteria bacterium]CAC9950649.1 hypothetical protein [uncultured Gammaproteobacteria bacterium]